MYTDIQIEAPDSARDGDVVNVIIKVTNLTAAALNIDVGGVTEPPDGLFMGFETRLIEPGATENFPGSFIMHDYDVTIHAYSYFQDTLDNEAQQVVTLKEVAPPVGCLPVVAGGILLVAGIIASIIAFT
ncbi:unnamed protein product [marine sediment metagenome]|uniref:CARDB domain-containing protein n=1 Tax=marine sediment metagenome TaxID=412755 RepID=X1TTY9_9ZZZZ